MTLGAFQAARLDLEAYADADFPGNDMRLVDPDGTATNATGWTLVYTVRAYDDASGSALITASSASGSGNRIVWINQATGSFTIAIDKAAIGALPRVTASTNGATHYRHQLQAVNDAEEVRLFFGDLKVWGVI